MSKHKAIYKVNIDSRFLVLHGTVEQNESEIVFIPNPVKDETPEIRVEIEIKEEIEDE